MNKTSLPKGCKVIPFQNEVMLIQHVHNYRQKSLKEKIEFILRTSNGTKKLETVLADNVFVKNEIIGMMVAIRNGEQFAIGISRCNRNLDKFSQNEGIELATDRARDTLAWFKSYNVHKVINVPFTMSEEYASFKERCKLYFNGDRSSGGVEFVGDVQLSLPRSGGKLEQR